ncbi:DUF58 domain-containing protein, partial [Methylobacterium sp. WL122]
EGDDRRHIDRNATARTGILHVRTHHDERDRAVVLLADFRPSMLFGTRRALRSVAAAEALASLGHTVEAVRIPALERDFALDVFNKLHVMEMKPAFRAATAGHEDQMYTMAKTMLSLPDTTMAEYVAAEQAAERLRDGYAAYFRDHDILLTPVLPVPAHKHGIKELVVDGKTVDLTYLQGATVPLNVTGLPGLSMRFGTSREGLPINVQVVGRWQAEATILHAAALLEGVSPVRGLHPSL